MQIPVAVVMVRPESFGFNPDTAPSFMFQREITESSRKEIERRARMEFDLLSGRLRGAGVELIVIEDQHNLDTPDAVFPNNWISFHHDGTVVLYPMLAPSRRPERRRDIIEKLEDAGFRASRVLDLTHHENQGRFLEGTGSVVFDHVHRTAYAAISPRTDERVLDELCGLLGYTPVTFRATYENGSQILHTDVTMSIGENFVILCADSIPEAAERKRVVETLKSSGREAITIDLKQLERFSANVLEVRTKRDRSALVISTSAWLALRPDQRNAIEKFTDILESPLPLFEGVGRGSARGMMADVHLPKSV